MQKGLQVREVPLSQSPPIEYVTEGADIILIFSYIIESTIFINILSPSATFPHPKILNPLGIAKTNCSSLRTLKITIGLSMS